MKFYTPLVLLEKQTHMDQPDQFSLLTATFCEGSNFINAGHDPIPNDLDEQGLLQINIYIARDLSLADVSTATPVIHSIELGPLPSPDQEIMIQVNVFERSRVDETEPKGSSTVSSAAANEKDRPVSAY